MLWLFLLLLPVSIYYFWRSKQYVLKAGCVSDPAEAVALRQLGVRNLRIGQVILAVWLLTLIAAVLFVFTL
ncbi:MAG: hypothetical protein JW862_03955 [Anaerolineales bacterium]|nr:hypothetical protein [Anaerolineales bacterium]